ncbi:MAG: ATP-binding protein [Lachnospiraceae bacterium]|nr:ATP-binding protein [Lachnospiraceae bacterium]
MHTLFATDLQKLNTLYNRLQFSFIFLYGRYNTGKTSLIREFCKNKKTVFFSAQETVPERQLQAFWEESVRWLAPRKQPAKFTDWEQAFSWISGFSFSHRLVLVLDEFQNLAEHCPGFMAAFEQAVQHDFPSGKVFLIVTSSSVSYARQLMQETTTSPFQAISARAFLTSVPFYTCQPYLAGYASREQLLLYGATGGLPSYIKMLSQSHSARENILALFFEKSSPLLFEPLTYLHRELREISTYNFLLEIIASDCSRLADIAAQASIGTNKCAKYLNTLIDLGILRKEFPAAGELQKKVRYVFTDHMLRFWYRFVYPNISGILFGRGEDIYDRQVLPALEDYLLPVLETVCTEYLERLADTGQTPFAYRHTGSWWCGGTKREPFFRIPLVATDENHTVLGICHSSGEPAGIRYFTALTQPLPPFGDKKRYLCIFSVSGFTEELREAAADAKNVWLIDLEDITAL